MLSIGPEGGEPHLPVKARLMRRHPRWRSIQVSRLPFEFVSLPVDPVGTAFKDDLRSRLGHNAKQAVAVHYSKWLDAIMKRRDRTRPGGSRLERGKNQHRV